MFRSAQNLLTLKDPILRESKNTSHRGSLNDLKTSSSTTTPLYAPVINRKLKSRESRISFQSSTDGSVHSNSSSSRTETDEENLLLQTSTLPNGVSRFPVPNESDPRKDRIKSVASSSADDESGFSSMNSFHQLPLPPLPMNSTMISNQFYMDGNEDCVDLLHHDLSIKPALPMRENGCPPELKNGLSIMHRRWDSAPPIPPKRNLTTFNGLRTNNEEDGNKNGIYVLWV